MNTSANSQHLLVFRFSSMGDVAMTVPVVKQLLAQHPALSITFVSDVKFAALFDDIPRLVFFAADIHGKYNGFNGLLQLFNELKKIRNVTAVADLHDVLRSQVLSVLFRTAGKKVATIDKGRTEKKALTRRQNKILVQLPTTFQRYADVFAKLGYTIDLKMQAERIKLPVTNAVQQLLNDKPGLKIGIAPVGKHKEKTYPVDSMEKVLAEISNKGNSIFLFGGGNERTQLENWQNFFTDITSVAGKLSFKEELMLISNLDMMVSMDSANMHLASLYGVPVVSIWGATHPYAGFYGFGQEPGNAVVEPIYCRPCSVFGSKPCYRGDLACMHITTPQMVINRINKVLQSAKR